MAEKLIPQTETPPTPTPLQGSDQNTDKFTNISIQTRPVQFKRSIRVVANSPAQITADTNNYNYGDYSVLRLTTDASRNITGFQNGTDGKYLTIVNVGSFNIVLVDESTSSSAANRLALSGDITIYPDESLMLWYDLVSLRWRQVGSREIRLPSVTRLANDFTKTTNTTLATVTGFTRTLLSGRIYMFKAKLIIAADATGGIKIDVGGTVTPSAVLWDAIAIGYGGALTLRITSHKVILSSALTDTNDTAFDVDISGTIAVTTGGTITIEFAQAASNGSSTIKAGSRFEIIDIT